MTAINVGAYNVKEVRISLKDSNLGRKLLKQQLDLPSDRPLPLTTEPSLPFAFCRWLCV